MRSNPRAFALPELIAILAIACIAIALLAVTTDRQRRAAGLTQSLAHLRQIAAWTGSYAADNDDRYWGFSWKVFDRNLSSYPDLRGPFSSDYHAMSAQAIDVLRRRTTGTFQLPPNWMPVLGHSHLTLADYAGASLPAFAFLSPGDVRRMLWARDPAGFSAEQYPPQPFGGPETAFIPYASSYEVMPAFFQSDNALTDPMAMSQGSTHTVFSIRGDNFRQRRIAEVAFPSQKVHLAEWTQSYFGSQDVYHLFPEARVPRLLADGSTTTRASSESNVGVDPFIPTRQYPLMLTYSPAAWDPPVPTGAAERIEGRYRWTRLGLRGRDFDGPEVFP